eukprot:1146217-Pelagomonas_calceolata.AAC.5
MNGLTDFIGMLSSIQACCTQALALTSQFCVPKLNRKRQSLCQPIGHVHKGSLTSKLERDFLINVCMVEWLPDWQASKGFPNKRMHDGKAP